MCEECEHMIDHNRHRRDETGRIRDTEAERIIDKRVWQALATDSAYRNAATAEEAAEREDEITRRIEQDFYGRAGQQRDPYHRGIQPS